MGRGGIEHKDLLGVFVRRPVVLLRDGDIAEHVQCFPGRGIDFQGILVHVLRQGLFPVQKVRPCEGQRGPDVVREFLADEAVLGNGAGEILLREQEVALHPVGRDVPGIFLQHFLHEAFRLVHLPVLGIDGGEEDLRLEMLRPVGNDAHELFHQLGGLPPFLLFHLMGGEHLVGLVFLRKVLDRLFEDLPHLRVLFPPAVETGEIDPVFRPVGMGRHEFLQDPLAVLGFSRPFVKADEKQLVLVIPRGQAGDGLILAFRFVHPSVLFQEPRDGEPGGDVSAVIGDEVPQGPLRCGLVPGVHLDLAHEKEDFYIFRVLRNQAF